MSLPSFRRVRHDISVLGVGAPLRAVYEASKRAGGHRLLFGGLARRLPPHRALGIVFPTFDVPTAVARLTIEHATRIVDGEIEIFGRWIPMEPSTPDWSLSRDGAGTWPLVPWWKLDIRSDDRLGDIKWAWEVGRSRHLVVLARAARLEPDGPYLGVLVDQLRSFIATNPVEQGIHWYSNLEISLRALAWLQVLSLTGTHLPGELVRDMEVRLIHSGRHLLADLPYTVSTMRNNHLLGDALGMVAIGRALGRGRLAAALSATGDRLMNRFLRLAASPGDGQLIEDSLSYHRFVLEMLTVRVIVGGAGDLVKTQLRASAQLLCRLGVLDGPVPQYGDWDEGRVLTTAGDPCDVVGSVRVALAVAGTGAPTDWRERHDDVAWYVGEGAPVAPEPPVLDGKPVGGGFVVADAGSYRVWLKNGGRTSHNHADFTAVSIRRGDEWIVGDPGTGTYNGPVEQRNYFRSSVSHSVLRIDDEDQLVAHRAFRWIHRASGFIGPSLVLGDTTVLWGAHDAYRRLERPCTVVRAVVVSPDSVAIGDWVFGDLSSRSFSLSVPLGPNAVVSAGESPLSVSLAGTYLALGTPGPVRVTRGRDAPFDGWWSPTYASMAASARIEVDGPLAPLVGWGVAETETRLPTVRGSALSGGGLAVVVDPITGGYRLTCTGGTSTQTADLMLEMREAPGATEPGR